MRGAEAEAFVRRFADFVGELNGRMASREWWAFTLAGKNPTVSPLASRCARGGFEPAAPTLKQRLNALLPSGPVFGFCRALWRVIRVRQACAWSPEPGKRYAVIATLVNRQSFRPDGSYRDTYFGDLSDRLAKKGLDSVVFGSYIADFEPSLERSQKQPGAPIVPMERFLTVGDLLSCLGTALRLRFFPPRVTATFDGRDVSRFVEAELIENVRASRFFYDLWYWHCAKAFLRHVKPAALYVPFENRCWERMLELAFREDAPGTPIVGYQHASTTLNHVNLVLGRGEDRSLPLPDRIVTLGEVTRERLVRRGGFPASKVVVGCALRQTPPPPVRTAPARAQKLLVTLATSVKEYAAVLRLLDEAFKDGGPEIEIRPHPEFSLAAGEAASGALSFKYRASTATLDAAMAACDVVLFASSTLGLEAIRQGIPAVFLDVADFLDLDPMYDFSALKWTARTGAELKAALAEITALPAAELARRRSEAAAYAARYFAAPTPEAVTAFLPAASAAPITVGGVP